MLSIFVLYGGKYPTTFDSYLFFSILISLILSIFTYLYLEKYSIVNKKNRKIITFIFIASFGLIHILNFKPLHTELIWVYPIYVLPQISIGYFCSVLRIKIGFIWGLLFHSFINFIGFYLL